MTTRKTLVKDQESCLIDESIGLLNSSVAPVSFEVAVPPPPVVQTNMFLFSLSKGNIYINRIDVGVEAGADIVGAGSSIRLVWFDNGIMSGSTHLAIVRDGFTGVPLVDGSIVNVGEIQADTNMGNFPMILTAPCIAFMQMVNAEALTWHLRFTMWSRPAPYELRVTPGYFNKLRNFSVK